MRKRKEPTVEDVIRMAVLVQARMAKHGVVLSWQMSWEPNAELVKGRPEKDHP